MHNLCLRLAVAATLVTTAFAGETAAKKVIEVEDKTWCETLWDYPVLYKNKDTFVQQFALTGRFHGDVYSVDAAQGYDQDWVIRRLRSGAVMQLKGDITIKGEVQWDPQNGVPAYQGFTDLYIGWQPSKAFGIKVGKQAMPFTNDGWISSNNLRTLERSNLSNNLWFTQEYFSAVTINGKINNWQYFLGVASAAVDEYFGDFDAGYFGVASIGYDFSKSLGAERALLRLDYVYQDPDPKTVATRQFEDVLSLHFDYARKKWGIAAEIAGGIGYGSQGDIWAAMIEPYYKITDRFEVVGRYTHIEGDDADSVRLNSRYEGTVVSGRGNNYNEFYLGLNYYICGDKLKLQTGLTYATMDDFKSNGGEYEGWQWVSGVRFSF